MDEVAKLDPTEEINSEEERIFVRNETMIGENSTTNGGTKFTVPCVPAVAAAFHVWIQKTTLHSTGAGWPGFNGNQWNSWTGSAPAQNTPNPVAFLMINEVVLY